MGNRFNRDLPRESFDIAMPDTFTDDLEWKLDLNEDEFIDAMDPEHVWYRSTVLKTRYIDDD